MIRRPVWAAVAAAVAALGTSVAGAARQADAPVALEIRVFDGLEEVTSQARIRLFEAGSQAAVETLRVPAGPATIEVAPGLYDIQAVLEEAGTVTGGMRWARQRLIQRYPDQHGRQLEVLNMQRGFGALQVRRASSLETGDVTWRAAMRVPGNATESAGRGVPGDGYWLFVAPAGQYDVEVVPSAREAVWLHNLELPADQTRFTAWQDPPPQPGEAGSF